MEIKNKVIQEYQFLREMFQDGYYPNHVVEKGVAILKDLCLRIESTSPKTLQELYPLTHEACEKFNDLEEDFEKAGSEIETVARDCIGVDFYFIAEQYGFKNADIEELIAPREW